MCAVSTSAAVLKEHLLKYNTKSDENPSAMAALLAKVTGTNANKA